MAGHDSGKTLDWIMNSKVLYATLVLLFAAYLLTRSILFPPLIALNIIGLFFAETAHGIKTTGLKHELTELVIAIAFALILWYGSSFLLQTSAPLDAIISCSMLPNLQRGDMVILQGANTIRAQGVEVDAGLWNSQDWAQYRTACAICIDNTTSASRPCLVEYDPITGKIGKTELNQSGRLIQFACGYCNVSTVRTAPSITSSACTTGITINNKTFKENLTNDVLVYSPVAGDTFKGEIIHRVYAIASVNGTHYYFTKGDNNPVFDLQFGTRPAAQNRTVGKVIFRLPFLGYAKLFLWGFYADPAGCEYVYLH